MTPCGVCYVEVKFITYAPNYLHTRLLVLIHKCKGCVDIPKDLVEKCRKDETVRSLANNETNQKQQEELDELKVLSTKHKLTDSLQLALDPNKRLVEEKDKLNVTEIHLMVNVESCYPRKRKNWIVA